MAPIPLLGLAPSSRHCWEVRCRPPCSKNPSTLTSANLGKFFSNLREILFPTCFLKKLYIDLWFFPIRLMLLENKNQKDVQSFSTFCPATYLPWNTELAVWLKVGVRKEGKIPDYCCKISSNLFSQHIAIEHILHTRTHAMPLDIEYILFICCGQDRHSPCSGAYTIEEIDIKKWLKWVIAQLHFR